MIRNKLEDLIIQLREENARLRDSRDAYKQQAEDAIAKLAKAVEVLSDFTWDETGTPNCWPNRDRIEELLAAAKGE